MKTALAAIIVGALAIPAMAMEPTEIADILADATVQIQATRYLGHGRVSNRTATGFWVSREYLMTAKHTFLNRNVADHDWGTYILDQETGLKCAVEFVGDHAGDAQLLRVLDMDNCLIRREPLVTYDTTPQIGDEAYTMGYPFNMGELFSGGHVSGWRPDRGRIITTVPSNPGNSGGVVVNDRAEVIGMTVSIIAHPQMRYWNGLTIIMPAEEILQVIRENVILDQ